MVTNHDIKQWIKSGLDSCEVEVTGDGRHFEAQVVSLQFHGHNTMQRHRMVYATLGGKVGTAIHALSLKTYTPDELED